MIRNIKDMACRLLHLRYMSDSDQMKPLPPTDPWHTHVYTTSRDDAVLPIGQCR